MFCTCYLKCRNFLAVVNALWVRERSVAGLALMYVHTSREQDRNQYRGWDCHIRKQWVLVLFLPGTSVNISTWYYTLNLVLASVPLRSLSVWTSHKPWWYVTVVSTVSHCLNDNAKDPFSAFVFASPLTCCVWSDFKLWWKFYKVMTTITLSKNKPVRPATTNLSGTD